MFIIQLFQMTTSAIRTLYALWQSGDITKADDAVKCAHRVVALMKGLGKAVHRKYDTAKCHDIYHIPYDLQAFGKADNCDTGI